MSAFTSAKIDRILALEPDLVLGFSDLQADIAAQLVRHGIEVHVFNQRSVAEILRVIRTLGGLVGCEAKAAAPRGRARARVASRSRAAAQAFPRRPRVYFEEWDEPQISCIRWVSELIGIAGGDDVFPELARRVARQGPHRGRRARSGAAQRRTSSSARGAARNSRRAAVAARAGWEDVPAVRDGELHEVKSSIILQPGPAALTDGVRELHRVIAAWVSRRNAGLIGDRSRDVRP